MLTGSKSGLKKKSPQNPRGKGLYTEDQSLMHRTCQELAGETSLSARSSVKNPGRGRHFQTCLFHLCNSSLPLWGPGKCVHGTLNQQERQHIARPSYKTEPKGAGRKVLSGNHSLPWEQWKVPEALPPKMTLTESLCGWLYRREIYNWYRIWGWIIHNYIKD